MSLPELIEANSGSHSEGLMQVSTEIVWRHLVHQIGEGGRRTLPPDLVVSETATDGGGKGHRGGRVSLCAHVGPTYPIELIVFGIGET